MCRPRLKGRLVPFTKKEECRARFLYLHQRLSSCQVAEILGRHPTGVRKALRRIGVKLRSMSDAAKIQECQGVRTFRVRKLIRRHRK
jgi:hypothetical protein